MLHSPRSASDPNFQFIQVAISKLIPMYKRTVFIYWDMEGISRKKYSEQNYVKYSVNSRKAIDFLTCEKLWQSWRLFYTEFIRLTYYSNCHRRTIRINFINSFLSKIILFFQKSSHPAPGKRAFGINMKR